MEKLPHYNFSWTVSLQNFGRGYGPVARQTSISIKREEFFDKLGYFTTMSESSGKVNGE
jgi:hypothetical protein